MPLVKTVSNERKGRVMVEWQKRESEALIALCGLTIDPTYALNT